MVRLEGHGAPLAPRGVCESEAVVDVGAGLEQAVRLILDGVVHDEVDAALGRVLLALHQAGPIGSAQLRNGVLLDLDVALRGVDGHHDVARQCGLADGARQNARVQRQRVADGGLLAQGRQVLGLRRRKAQDRLAQLLAGSETPRRRSMLRPPPGKPARTRGRGTAQFSSSSPPVRLPARSSCPRELGRHCRRTRKACPPPSLPPIR